MERRHIVDALAGRVSSVVVDAYIERIVRRSDGDGSITFLPASDDDTQGIALHRIARMVALPIKSKSGWTLAIADSATRDVTILTSVEAPGNNLFNEI